MSPVPMKKTSEGWCTLYHATTTANANSIVQEQRFRPGQSGLLGGNIYFSKERSQAIKRRRKRGGDCSTVVLSAFVKLGRCGHWRANAIDVSGQTLNAHGLHSAKVYGQDAYCVCSTNSYREDPASKIKWIRIDEPSDTENDSDEDDEDYEPDAQRRRTGYSSDSDE